MEEVSYILKVNNKIVYLKSIKIVKAITETYPQEVLVRIIKYTKP